MSKMDVERCIDRLKDEFDIRMFINGKGLRCLGWTRRGKRYVIRCNGKDEIKVLEKLFREKFHEEAGKTYASTVIDHLSLKIEGRKNVFLRFAQKKDMIEHDLNNEDHKVVRVAKKVSVISDGTAPFVKPKSMREVPPFKKVTNAKKWKKRLRFLLNFDEEYFMLGVLWLLAAMRPQGPFHILALQGEPKTGKSFAADILRSLIDPADSLSIRMPTRERDLVDWALDNWIVSINNIREPLKPAMAAALNCLSTGGGTLLRKGGVNDGVTGLDICRPIILNGIDQYVVTNDLADRCIFIHLSKFKEGLYRSPKLLNRKFKEWWPGLLGALYEAVRIGLKNVHKVEVTTTGRMPDFLAWAVAAGGAFGWTQDEIVSAYENNRQAALMVFCEADPMVGLVKEFLKRQRDGEWEGFVNKLREELARFVGSGELEKVIPKAANSLSSRVRAIMPMLRAVGVDVAYRKMNKGMMFKIVLMPGCEEEV